MTGYELVDIWAQSIVAANDFHAWCTATFGSPVKIFVGLDESRRPGRDDAPYVQMHPLGDARGPEAEFQEWGVWLSMGICAPDRKPETSGMLVTEPALQLMDNEFCPRLLSILHTSAQPPHTGEGITLPGKGGYVQRDVTLSLSEETAMGLGDNGWR